MRHQDLLSLSEWKSYESAPSRETLVALTRAAKPLGGDILTEGLRDHFVASRQWKVAQHLALLLGEQGQATLAFYFADKAVKLSGGDPFARCSLASALWHRRLPLAVLYQTPLIRLAARRVREESRRRLLQDQVAELNVLAYAYLRDFGSVRRWLRLLLRRNSVSCEVLVQLLLGARRGNDDDITMLAANVLAPNADRFGGVVKGEIKRGLHLQLLGLCRRHWGIVS